MTISICIIICTTNEKQFTNIVHEMHERHEQSKSQAFKFGFVLMLSYSIFVVYFVHFVDKLQLFDLVSAYGAYPHKSLQTDCT